MNPATATFTSMDSYAGNIYDPASLHRYLYANANPVKYTDPSGHSPLASLTTAVSQLTVLQTNAIILSMATVSGLMNMAMKTLMCVVDGKGLPSASEYGKAFIEGFYIGCILGTFSMFAAACMNLTLLEMYLCIGGGTAAKLAIDGAIAAYKGDVKGAVINGLFALFSMAAFSKMYGVYTETTISSGPGNATKVECKPDGTCEQKNNVPSEEIDTVTVSKSGGETASGNVGAGGSETKFSPINPGPLDINDANSFRSATYIRKVLTEDTTFYRVYSSESNRIGPYMTRTPQNGVMQSQLDLALNPDWGNNATNVELVTVPKGTTIYEGVAAPQTINGGAGNLLGGGNQIFINREDLDESWFHR